MLATSFTISSPCLAMRASAMHALAQGNLPEVVKSYDLIQGGSTGVIKQKADIDAAAQRAGHGTIVTIKALIVSSAILVKVLIDAADAYNNNASIATDTQLEDAYLAVKDKKLAIPSASKAAFDAAVAHASTQY